MVSALPSPEASSSILMDARWAKHYETLDELLTEADLVVRGRVDAAFREFLEPTALKSELPVTDFTFRIDEVLAGERPERLVIRQTGGMTSRGKVEVRDDRLMRPGEEYVLFLVTPDRQTYVVIGGPQGRFIVDQGAISSLSARDRSIVDLGIRDLPLTSLRRQ